MDLKDSPDAFGKNHWPVFFLSFQMVLTELLDPFFLLAAEFWFFEFISNYLKNEKYTHGIWLEHVVVSRY